MTNRRRLLSLIVIAAIPFVARWVHHEFRAPAGTTEDVLPYALLALMCVAIVAILEAPPRTSSVTRVFVESTVAALSVLGAAAASQVFFPESLPRFVILFTTVLVFVWLMSFGAINAVALRRSGGSERVVDCGAGFACEGAGDRAPDGVRNVQGVQLGVQPEAPSRSDRWPPSSGDHRGRVRVGPARQIRPQHDDSHPQEVLAGRRVRMALTDARRRHLPSRASQARHQRGLLRRRHLPPRFDLSALDVRRRVEAERRLHHARDYISADAGPAVARALRGTCRDRDRARQPPASVERLWPDPDTIRPAKPEGDDVVGVDARLAKHAKKRKREVLVEKDLHDALRTAGAWCAATWAA